MRHGRVVQAVTNKKSICMKHTNHLLAAAFCLAASATMSHAQTLRIGPAAGWLHSMPSGQESGDGLYAGVSGEVDFSGKRSGLFAGASLLLEKRQWDSNGYLYAPGSGDQASVDTWHYTTYSLKIPLSVGYGVRLSGAARLYAAAGPYLSIGIAGKEKVATYVPADGQMLEKKVSGNVFADHIMNRVGWGIGAGAGAELWSHYRVGIAYDHSMSDIFSGGHSDSRHRTLSVGVGYMF